MALLAVPVGQLGQALPAGGEQAAIQLGQMLLDQIESVRAIRLVAVRMSG